MPFPALAAIELLTLIAGALGLLKKKGMNKLIKVNRYIEDLIELERNEGARTEAFAKIKEGAETGSPVTLTADEAIYLDLFKSKWDRYFKKPLARAAELFGDDEG